MVEGIARRIARGSKLPQLRRLPMRQSGGENEIFGQKDGVNHSGVARRAGADGRGKPGC
jgi:hypothetical protein